MPYIFLNVQRIRNKVYYIDYSKYHFIFPNNYLQPWMEKFYNELPKPYIEKHYDNTDYGLEYIYKSNIYHTYLLISYVLLFCLFIF